MERAVQQLSASCSYSTPPILPRGISHQRRRRAVIQPQPNPNSSCSTCWQPSASKNRFAGRPMTSCAAVEREEIQGYTPAQFISWTDEEEYRCHHMVAVEVDAPASVCYALWDDWSRMVDYLDLITQIGLDPNEPELGLFQCFYRWGKLPIMEIVFLAKKLHTEKDRLLRYETIWGMPAAAEVTFIQGEGGAHTTVIFKLEHQLPHLLVDLKIGVFGVETHLRQILTENMAEFKSVAEAEAKNPAPAASKQAAAGTSKAEAVDSRKPGAAGSSSTGASRDAPAAPSGTGEPAQQPQSQAQAQVKPAGRGRGRSKAPDAAAAAPKQAAAAPKQPAAPQAQPQQQKGGQAGQGGKPRGRAKSTTPAAS